MVKFSCILIAVEKPALVVSAIHHIRPFVDEVILIYSNRKYLNAIKNKFKGDKKINVYYAIALGLAEVYKQYAQSLCTNEWIISLDTDERFSKYTLTHLDQLAVGESRAYKIMRSERKGYTWQYRIWKKGALVWRGFVHEHPLIMTKTKKLGSAYKLSHTHLWNNITTYDLLQKYQGESLLRQVLRDAWSTYMIKKTITFEDVTGSIARHRKEKNSLSKSDKQMVKQIKFKGTAQLIGSNTSKGVAQLNKKYQNKQQGTELLIEILKTHYK